MENKSSKYPFDLYDIKEEEVASIKSSMNENKSVVKMTFSDMEEFNMKKSFNKTEYTVEKRESNRNNSDEEDSEEENLDMFENNVKIVKSEEQLYRAINKVSFYEGRPKDVEEILKLECPLYSCSRNTIIAKTGNLRKVSFSQRTSTLEAIKKSKTKDASSIFSGKPRSVVTASKNNHKKKSALDINLANTFQIKTFNSLFMTILHIINIIIRYTIIQFPFCLKALGIVWGSLIIVIVGSMSIFSIWMLIKVKESTNENSYTGFAYRWWGMKGKLLILILNMLQSLGSCLSYIIIFLKIIPKLINFSVGTTFIADETLLSVILGIWLLFYCFQKDVSGIKSAAYYGVFGIIMFLILNIINLVFLIYTEEIPDGEKNINFFTLNLDYSATSSIYCIILSFSFHTYAFSIYECLDTPDPKKMLVTSSVGIFISMLIYLLIGSIGYILYGDTITDDILTTVGFSGIGVLEYISFAVIVVTSFPLTFSALKHYFIYLIEIILTMTRDKLKEKKVKNQQLVSQNTEVSQNKDSEIVRVTNYVQKHSNDKNHQDHGIAQNQNEHDNSQDSVHLDLIHIPEFVEFILVFGLFLGIFIFARKFPNLKLIFSILGSTTANIFTFILPALYFIKFSTHHVCNWKNILPSLFIIIGIGGMVISLIFTVKQFMEYPSHH